ncbi:MAG: hypothetical protein R3C14_27615 [Caldilineaceae bacterium]
MSSETIPVDAKQHYENPLTEVAASVRYMTDARGDRTDVVLPLPLWEKLIEWLEDVEDRTLTRLWQQKLSQGPKVTGALRWDTVADEWDDDETI